MEWWHWALGGGGLLLMGGAVAKKVTTSAPKSGGLLTSEQARAQQLIPPAQVALAHLQAELSDRYGIDTYVGSVRRTPKQQAGNVAKGVSATQHSWHLLDRAVDLYPLLDDGKPDLNGKLWDTAFRRMHIVAAQFGWRGLAFNTDGTRRYITTTKGKVWDGGHIEFPEGMTWEQASHQKGGGLA